MLSPTTSYKEALCVVFAAERWASSLCNKTVFVYCDNTAAVAMINKGSTITNYDDISATFVLAIRNL